MNTDETFSKMESGELGEAFAALREEAAYLDAAPRYLGN